MTFIVSLVALLIERFFDWTHLRHWYWFTHFQQNVYDRLSDKSPYVVLAITIVPLLIAVFLIQLIIQDWLYGFVKLVFQLFVLIYCLGPQNLWAEAFSRMNGSTKSTQRGKRKTVVTDKHVPKHFLDMIFIEANRRVFTVLFWYVLLGPIGAVLYRTMVISSDDEVAPELSQSAKQMEEALNWLPDRLVTFIFALGGHFAHVLSCWRKNAFAGLGGNNVLLTQCGIAALGIDDEKKIPDDGSAENHAISLLDRSFVIMLALIAVVAFIF